ncbi:MULTISPECIES: hypothetical protein [Agrobacterium]|uniref:hypothetical protein n=1 Tax=Agrobacterium TaxID=357 RepID=UPI0009D16043|nr:MULTISPECIES: hypothetical protein [Agrobacterium]CUX70045.1 hypothetical protein AGR6A_pAt20020 [Agrobacterium sp. NCPPB 925]
MAAARNAGVSAKRVSVDSRSRACTWARQGRANVHLRGYDDDGDVIPVENLCQRDALDAAIRAIEANETAVDILVAQRRTEIAGWRIDAVSRQLNSSLD